jgi:CRISPR-associated protein Cas6/Cse3/CasE subtype I-E
MVLNLIRFELMAGSLYAWARRAGIPTDDRDYLMHHAMVALFGDHYPRPFQHRERGRAIEVLGYTTREPAELRELALSSNQPVLNGGLNALAGKPMPVQFAPGRVLGFETRLVAVKCNAAGKRKDAFLAALDRGVENPVRDDVYLEWLARKLEPACSVLQSEVSAFRLIRSRRSLHNTSGAKSRGGISFPDVTFSGILRVNGADAFHRMIAEGVGTQRAFGFGALFLKPATAERAAA